MPQSLAKIYIHLVFSTKNREPFLTDTVRDDLHAYMATSLNNLQCPVVLMNSIGDHIHILFRLSRTITISSAVEEVKKLSSKWLKTQSTTLQSFAWQNGYGAFSVSESNVPAVCEYIANQREHHRINTFQDEYRAMLKRHGIQYDERYVWD